MSNLIFFDIECYINYFLICFKEYKTGNTLHFELNDTTNTIDNDKLKRLMMSYTSVGFNSRSYDIPMLIYAMQGKSNKELKAFSDELITSKEVSWKILKKYKIFAPHTWDHIDLINPSKIGSQVFSIGLKTYGANLHSQKIQELPFESSRVLTKDEMLLLREYCFNDIQVTVDLYHSVKENLDLRSEISKIYGIDLRSKSDAQIAETIFKMKLNVTSFDDRFKLGEIFKCSIPDYIKFKDKVLQGFVDNLKGFEFKCNEKGKFELPSFITDVTTSEEDYQLSMLDDIDIKDIETDKILIAGKEYTIGVGGLHSTEKHQATTISEDEFLIDADVTSYYPSIILNNSFYPKHLGNEFLILYKEVYEGRIKAKIKGDIIKSSIFKIVLNGSFGKFGSRYSCLYSPELLLSTTITGQLSLLMLIEMIVNTGCKVVSANTDGITIKGKKADKEFLDLVLEEWQKITNFNLEYTDYRAVYNEGVNSYIAITTNGKVKAKGIYAKPSIAKNPTMSIVAEAIIAYLKDGVSIEKTIKECTDICKFLIVRKVKEGATWRGEYLGKIVRWYYSSEGEAIRAINSDNKVAGSDNAIPMQLLSDDIPRDLDYNIYIIKAYKLLKKLGVK